MGTFYVKCKIANAVDRTRSVVLPKVLVDGGSEYTWVPERSLERIAIQREKKDLAFVLANGQPVTRSVGFAIIRLGKFFTIDEVVFAEKGDRPVLGARTLAACRTLQPAATQRGADPPKRRRPQALEGLNLTIDPARKKLVAAGPLPAAAQG